MRIPRPKHITNLAVNYNKTKDKQLLSQLLQVLLSQYVTNGFQLNGQPLSLQDISFKYQVDIQTIYREMTNISKTVTGFINTKDLLASHEGLLAMGLEATIRDKGLISSQLSRLLGSQGDTYKPFITPAVNDILKVNLQATKNLIDLANAFIPKNTEIVQMIQDKGQAQLLPVHEAIDHIRSISQGAIQDNGNKALPPAQSQEDLKAQIYQDHQLSSMPEVRANPAEESENMINVKARKLIESNETSGLDINQELIEDVEKDWEQLK